MEGTQSFAQTGLPPINNEEQKTSRDINEESKDDAVSKKVPFVEIIEALKLMDLEFYRREMSLS